MTDIEKKVSKKHNIRLAYCESVEVTGVENVISYDEVSVSLKLADNVLNIKGIGLDIKTLDIERGMVLINGRVSSLIYSSSREKIGFIKRLLK